MLNFVNKRQVFALHSFYIYNAHEEVMTNREEDKKKPKIITEIAYKNEQVVNSGDVDKIHVSTAGVETSASLSIPITINGEEKIFN